MQVLILKGLHARTTNRFPRGKERDSIGRPQLRNNIILEELSWVKENLGGVMKRSEERRKAEENKHVAVVIRKLDKDTLNLYTSLRAELGTRELSWIGLKRVRPEQRARVYGG